MNVLSFILENKIIAISRQIATDKILNLAKALYAGGIKLLEITFDQSSDSCIENTMKSISIIKNEFEGKLCVGAGTVLTVEQAEKAFEAGADYILSPDTNIQVIQRTKQLGMISIPGALTPTEILQAWNAGADIVKLFPASLFGVPYLNAIKGPINHVPLMAVGGIDENNFQSFLASGFCGCGVGGNLVKKDLINKEKFEEIGSVIRFVDIPS